MEQAFEVLAHRWEENEIFYKALYEAKRQGPDVYAQFLARQNPAELQKSGLYVPELAPRSTKFPESVPIFRSNLDIAVWKHSRYTPFFFHQHEYFEILYVMEGAARHQVDEDEAFEISPGDVCILPDTTTHALEAMSDDCIIINIMLKKSTFQDTFRDILSADNMISQFFQNALFGSSHARYLFFRTGENPEIRRCVKNLFVENYNRKIHYDRILKSEIVCFFVYLLRRYEQYFVPGKHSLDLEILKYLQHSTADITLESAAQHFNYNPAYFSRLVHKLTGRSFSNLLKQHRMEIACQFLRESSLPIGQIYTLAGYSTLAHFNRSFKKMYNQTPTQYRNAHKVR